jgi:hypothetical protein
VGGKRDALPHSVYVPRCRQQVWCVRKYLSVVRWGNTISRTEEGACRLFSVSQMKGVRCYSAGGSSGSRVTRAAYCTSALPLATILVPATEHGYFVASWWRTPLHHPPKVTRLYFQQTSGIHAPVGKRKGCSLSSRSPAPIADCFHVATMARKHSVLNLREINRNNTHTALVSVLTYYGWVSLIF